jgi:Acetyltransferase (GNAT) family.
MQIIDFTTTHAAQAAKIAIHNYMEERDHVPALPPIDVVPDLTAFAENSLGVAAFDSGEMVGFLCAVGPFQNAFRSTDAVGVFSPMGANGAVGSKRAEVYARMYQAVGEKWAKAGASSHAVCIYAHDRETQEQFFRYGFGMRTVDAIRMIEEIDVPPCEAYDFSELHPEKILSVLSLENMLDEGYIASPFFMFRERESESEFLKKYEHFKSVYVIAKHQDKIIAFMRAELDGENFICDMPGYLHVKGAYCLPEHRGKGVNNVLLNMLIQKLKERGYSRLGVDFESINPSGSRFWRKYFDAYTYGVVRRIDEHAITKSH